MNECTAGPWIVFVCDTEHHILPAGRPGEIAEVYNGDDARLIAAAPDMLDALRKVRAFTENELDVRGPDAAGVTLALLNEIDRAIAKAEGRDA